MMADCGCNVSVSQADVKQKKRAYHSATARLSFALSVCFTLWSHLIPEGREPVASEASVCRARVGFDRIPVE